MRCHIDSHAALGPSELVDEAFLREVAAGRRA
jgi:hypothetical protein